MDLQLCWPFAICEVAKIQRKIWKWVLYSTVLSMIWIFMFQKTSVGFLISSGTCKPREEVKKKACFFYFNYIWKSVIIFLIYLFCISILYVCIYIQTLKIFCLWKNNQMCLFSKVLWKQVKEWGKCYSLLPFTSDIIQIICDLWFSSHSFLWKLQQYFSLKPA